MTTADSCIVRKLINQGARVKKHTRGVGRNKENFGRQSKSIDRDFNRK